MKVRVCVKCRREGYISKLPYLQRKITVDTESVWLALVEEGSIARRRLPALAKAPTKGADKILTILEARGHLVYEGEMDEKGLIFPLLDPEEG